MSEYRELSSYQKEYDEEIFFQELIEESYAGTPNNAECENFKESIKRKTWSMLAKTHKYIIEDNYVEIEWRDMIAEHYVHTSYEHNPYTVRVHLFKEYESNEEHEIDDTYLGFFTLRKLNCSGIMLSFIFPNWRVLKIDESRFLGGYIIAARRMVHLFGYNIEIETTPFFRQDGAVTCCAQANILMLSHLLALKHGNRPIRIKEMAGGSDHETQYPTKGLDYEDMMDILSRNHIKTLMQKISYDDSNETVLSEVRGTVKAHIRSGLPVILLIRRHAVLIVGFREEEDADVFFFYDDSGALIQELEGNQNDDQNKNDQYDHFISSCKWNYLKDYVNKTRETVRLLIPFHERVFADYIDIHGRTEYFEKELMRQGNGNRFLMQHKRFFLAKNTECKAFIRKNIIHTDAFDKEVRDFLSASLPLYLWCLEFVSQDTVFIFFIDTTYNMIDMTKNIFLNTDMTPFIVSERFHTLTRIQTEKVEKERIPSFPYVEVVENEEMKDEAETEQPASSYRPLKQPAPLSAPLTQVERHEEGEKEKGTGTSDKKEENDGSIRMDH